jgi:tetratricopeptide (TPR) repeat protein
MKEPLDHLTARTAREAEGYYELGLFEDALQRAEELIRCGKLGDPAWMLKAECLRSLGRWAEGSAAFDEVLRRDPSSMAAYIGLGWCRKREGRLDLAVESMERLLRQRPDEPIGLYNLACYLSLAGDRERSLDLLRQAVDADASYRELAAREDDLSAIRGDGRFARIISNG